MVVYLGVVLIISSYLTNTIQWLKMANIIYYLILSVLKNLGDDQLSGSHSGLFMNFSTGNQQVVQLSKDLMSLEDLFQRWLIHIAAGRRSQFLADCCQKDLISHQVDLPVGCLNVFITWQQTFCRINGLRKGGMTSSSGLELLKPSGWISRTCVLRK